MQEYCENQISCRRQVFSEKFTEVRLTAHRCGKMCDNCAAKLGSARRNFLPINLSGSSGDRIAGKKRPLEMKVVKKRTTTSLSNKDEDGWEEVQRPETSSRQSIAGQQQPRATFMKASLFMSNNTSNQDNKSAAVPKRSKPPFMVVQSNNENVINLLDDNNDGLSGPLNKRGKR